MLERLRNNEFIKNFTILLGGTLLAQVFPVAISPILAHYYSPEEFGVFTLYFSICTLLAIVVAGRYEIAIVLPSDEKDAQLLAQLCYLVSAVFSICVFGIALALPDLVAQLLGIDQITGWLPLVALSVFVIGIFQTIGYQLSRAKAFKSLSFAKILLNLVIGVASLLLGLANYHSGLIIGLVLGQVIAAVFMHVKFNAAMFSSFDYAELKRVAKKYRDFILLNSPTALLDKLSVSIPVFFIGKHFGQQSIGMYGLVERVVGGPVSLVSYSISQVLLRTLTEKINQGISVYPYITKMAAQLALVAIVPFVILFFFSEEIFELIFGGAWAESGSMAGRFAPVFFIRFVVSPLSVVFLAKHHLKPLVVWQASYFVCTLGITLLAGIYQSFDFFVTAYTISEFVNYIIYLILILKAAKN